MKTCPNCGHDLSAPKRLVAVSAAELVESLQIDIRVMEWNDRVTRVSMPTLEAELEAFKDRMRANGYRTNAGPVKDATAAFRTHMRNAVKYASQRTGRPAPNKPQRTVAPPKEL